MTKPRKKYIFYLHPAPGTALCTRLDEYWKTSKMVCGQFGERKRNEALKYPYHVTLTSFFRMDAGKSMEQLVEIAKEAFKDVPTSPVTTSRAYMKPNAHIEAGPRSNSNMAGLKVTAPSVSASVSKLVTDGAAYGLRSDVVNSLHLTLYNGVTYETMKSLEVGMADVIRATPWEQAWIVLWETDNAYTKWTQIHNFSA